MRNKIYRFWDFDGSLIDSPLPDYGKEQYERIKGIKYPHIGWWGRVESLDLNIFDIQANPRLKSIILKSFETENEYNYILTSRIYKLKNEVKAVLLHNGINPESFEDFSMFTAKHKGERILDIIYANEESIKEIHVYEDRDKEFLVLEEVRTIIESYDIKYLVHEIKIDEDFNR